MTTMENNENLTPVTRSLGAKLRSAVLPLVAVFAIAGTNVSCDTKTPEPTEETQKETDKYTPEEWATYNGIKLNSELFFEGKPTGLIATPIVVAGDDGKYYLKPEFKLDKDIITQKALKVSETSGYGLEDMAIYINVNRPTGDASATGFESTYFDLINRDGDVFLSSLSPNSFGVNGNDFEKLYKHGESLMLTIAVRLNAEISSELIERKIITPDNQNDYTIANVFIYSLGK